MTSDTQSENAAKQGGRGWQVAAFLVLGLAMVGSLPSIVRLYDMIAMGVTWERAPFARQQQALWQRNEMCASMPGEEVVFPPEAESAGVDRPVGAPRQIATFTGMKVRLQACWNGDVLVRTVGGDGKGRAVWMAAEGYARGESQAATSSGTPADADATGTASSAATFDVICQSWGNQTIDSGRVIRVVSPGGTCVRETIDILTGEIARAETVPCDAGCQPDTE